MLTRFLILSATALGALSVSAGESLIDDSNPLTLPKPGAHQLRILTPRVLELTLITTKEPAPAPIQQWNFIATNGNARLPSASEFSVIRGGAKVPVTKVGFKRRVLYAPLRQRDLRIANELYLQLGEALPPDAVVEVKNASGRLWPAGMHFTARLDASRLSPVLHVNQVGYAPAGPKMAMAGYYLGSLGELPLPAGEKGIPFSILENGTTKIAFSGTMKARRDSGFPFTCYQEVFEADFSDLRTPGEYRLIVPELGTSYPFWIGEGAAAAVARDYALGLYHQRCGTNNVMPFTRHTHGVCHILPAAVPLPQTNFVDAWKIIADKTEEAGKNPRHTAKPLADPATCLYPFNRTGEFDVSGGHHDAGDYSKYTINSACWCISWSSRRTIFAEPSSLDNLGIPESGDGKSDCCRRPSGRPISSQSSRTPMVGFTFWFTLAIAEYENDVLPENGDRQIVWPKTTAVTAAAVAALGPMRVLAGVQETIPAKRGALPGESQKGMAIPRTGNREVRPRWRLSKDHALR